jgi:hypothetical protein
MTRFLRLLAALGLLAAAVQAVGRDRTAIRDWLARRQAEGAFAGVTGPIAFLESGDPVGKAFTMTRVVGGKLTVVDPAAAPAAPAHAARGAITLSTATKWQATPASTNRCQTACV